MFSMREFIKIFMDIKRALKASSVAIVFLFALLFSAQTKASAQNDSVSAFLFRMQNFYRNANYLGFHVKYTYANAGRLDRHVDSLAGDISMDKGRVKYEIDGTETLINDRYSIYVVKENKLIYLSKPVSGGMMDLVGMLDSMLVHIKGASAEITYEKGREILSVHYPPGQQYKNVRLVMNTGYGWLERMEYDLYTKGLIEQDQMSSEGHPRSYDKEGRVTILFSNYRTGGFKDSLFDEGMYFTRENGEFKTAGLYKDYQVFLASSNL